MLAVEQQTRKTPYLLHMGRSCLLSSAAAYTWQCAPAWSEVRFMHFEPLNTGAGGSVRKWPTTTAISVRLHSGYASVLAEVFVTTASHYCGVSACCDMFITWCCQRLAIALSSFNLTT
jgi:hypothetical protein